MYNFVVLGVIVVSLIGIVWASAKMEKARKDGKIRYHGKVRIDDEPK